MNNSVQNAMRSALLSTVLERTRAVVDNCRMRWTRETIATRRSPRAIGALFALALYLAVRGGLLDFVKDVPHTVYFYATLAFLAGFSERRAKVLLDSVGGGSEPAAETNKSGP